MSEELLKKEQEEETVQEDHEESGHDVSSLVTPVKSGDEVKPDYDKDPTSGGAYSHRYGQEPFMGRTQPNYDEHTHTPAKPEVKNKAEQIAQANLTKYFASFTNESNLKPTDWIYMTVSIREKGNTQHSSQFCLQDKLAELLNGAYSAIRFKNDARAKSVIALIYNATEMGSAKNITWMQKYNAIEAILKEHPNVNPR